jgi:dihydroorotase
MIRRAKFDGLAITCDVAVHHVHLSEMDIGYFDPNCRVMPPFRSERDREALRRGLSDGTVDTICSDHTPVDEDAKQLPFSEAEAGVTGLELLLPLTLKWAGEMDVPLMTALARITADSARRPMSVCSIRTVTGKSNRRHLKVRAKIPRTRAMKLPVASPIR